jgi:hypothetical protein
LLSKLDLGSNRWRCQERKLIVDAARQEPSVVLLDEFQIEAPGQRDADERVLGPLTDKKSIRRKRSHGMWTDKKEANFAAATSA